MSYFEKRATTGVLSRPFGAACAQNEGMEAQARGGPRRRRTTLARLAPALVGLAALTAGCASTPGAPAAAEQTTGSAVRSAAEAAEAAQYDADTPPEAAQMVCSDEIRGQVADALALPSDPTATSAWADHVYTCTYALPMGQLVLAVSVSPSAAAARGQLETLRQRLGADDQEQGLGEQAYSAAAGTVLAVKDNMVLWVNATGLPDDLGAGHAGRLDLARVIAAGVFNCWVGNS